MILEDWEVRNLQVRYERLVAKCARQRAHLRRLERSRADLRRSISYLHGIIDGLRESAAHDQHLTEQTDSAAAELHKQRGATDGRD